jgi:hypothetical protein
VTAGYSGTPLPQKLGIKADSRALLVGAPAGFQVGDLPPGAVVLRRRSAIPFDVILLFCRDMAALNGRFAALVPSVRTAGALWVCWPKRSSGVLTDLSENAVRDHGLAVGLVDVKVAALDDTWSALKFVRRLADR